MRYVREAYVPTFIIAAIMFPLMLAYSSLHIRLAVYRLLAIFVTGCLTAFLVYRIGLTSGERVKVKNGICGKIKTLIKNK